MKPNRTPTRINPEGSWLSSWLLLPSHQGLPWLCSSLPQGQDRLGSLRLLKKLIQGVLVVIVVVALHATKVLLGTA
jgi:hypothetical protein